MKVAVVGAGSVGCYYGGLLARAGHAVTLIGRERHVAAIRARGLVVERASGSETVRPDATTVIDGAADAALVLVCVKSGDTDAAGRALAPVLAPDAAVLSLQNGVDNAERLSRVLGRTVVPSAVYVATEMAGPGHVRHLGRGDLVIGPGPASEAVAAAFREAAIPTTVSPDALGALWSKLVLNCAYNALSAATRLPYGHLVGVAGVPAAMADIVAECAAVAEAAGVRLPADTLASVLALAETMPGQLSSTAQDVMRGKPSEIDHLNGFIARKGAELGVAVPVNRLLHALVKALEAGADAPG
ncbi:ketopantoate reductase family protein [Methylobacterium radiodurans]|uniref:2-dehydropantoate 2-reductase n=1 Tax=Methylobacterium radiodurans TaxID=2202828 RepID=A0A2U8VTL6_9HYPH|nr:ketopantoate reductase family protein [Methylobacterium radiodurans]AWN37139.1 2-dehydropantoate 2-reductase [Methylobacterium radiodurans]